MWALPSPHASAIAFVDFRDHLNLAVHLDIEFVCPFRVEPFVAAVVRSQFPGEKVRLHRFVVLSEIPETFTTLDEERRQLLSGAQRSQVAAVREINFRP